MATGRWASTRLWGTVKTALKLTIRSRCCEANYKAASLRPFLFGGGIFLGYHRDGNRERLFQSHSRSLESILAAEKLAEKPTIHRLCRLLREAFGVLYVMFRTLEMLVIILPLVVTGPIAMKSRSFRENHWFRLLVATIEYCGPVYVKLGQWAATRRDLFPTEMCEKLARLQRHTQVHDWSHTQRVLEKALGSKARVRELFEDFDPDPIGSGCCAQVYRAVIDRSRLPKGSYNGGGGSSKDGKLPVAVKVLHPQIKQQFDRDLQVLRSLTSLLSVLFPSLKWLSLSDSLEEFAFSMNVQLDLTTEAENMLQFRRDFQHSKDVVFPAPILDLCYPEMIVQTFEEGMHLSQIMSRLDDVDARVKKKLAAMGVDLILKMIFSNNYVHADLHSGNILVRGIDSGDLKLVILDSGIVATLDKLHYGSFHATFTAIVKGDGRQVGKLFLETSVNNCQQPHLFIEEMNDIVVEVRDQQLSLSNVDVADLLHRVFKVLRDHQVKLDANFASVILAIMILEGIGRSLDPDLDLVWKATPYLMESKLNELYSGS